MTLRPIHLGRTAAAAAVLLLGSTLGMRAQQEPLAYAGSETCQACHEDIYNSFQKNRHAALDTDKKRGWETRACESCHGPGAKHAESAEASDIRQPAKLAPAQTDRDCLTCHLNQPTHIGRIQGGHAKNQVACVSCHSVHKPAAFAETNPKAARLNRQCAQCHTSVWTSFQRPHSHRLAEGAMSCIDCHNPHGSFFPKNLQTVSSNEPGCLRCHGDKRGPFVYEHAPVRLEGCTACHEPHGSANPRMLARHEVRNQCLECHANLPVTNAALGGVPPAFHDLRSPRFRNCTICHMKVHGSNVSRALLR